MSEFGINEPLTPRFPKVGTAVPSLLAGRDPHETSFPLLLLGSVMSVSAVLKLARPGSALGQDWPAAVLLTVAFTVIWLVFRHRAARRGVRCPSGFGIAAIIGLIITLPTVILGLFEPGPFLIFGLGLLTAGIKQRNRFLAMWAVLTGAVGIFESYFGITNRLPPSVWAGWEHPAICLSLGLLTITAGLIMRLRENRG